MKFELIITTNKCFKINIKLDAFIYNLLTCYSTHIFTVFTCLHSKSNDNKQVKIKEKNIFTTIRHSHRIKL